MRRCQRCGRLAVRHAKAKHGSVQSLIGIRRQQNKAEADKDIRLMQYANAARQPLREHGILLALPLSLMAWMLIYAMAFPT